VDTEWFDQEENSLLSRADCVICSSLELHATFNRNGHKAHYVPHGVDWTLFRKAVDENLPLPDDLRGIPEPRLGFYGFLSDEWVDFSLLKRLASERPQWHIVLIGRPKAGADMSMLLPRPNIHYLGLKPFEELPAYTRHFAVGLIPFRLNQLTTHSNPLKLLEYLSGGLPVVSTDIPEVRRYADAVRIARSPEQFIAQCEKALNEGDQSSRERRSAAVETSSWEKRMEQVSEIVRESVEQRTARRRVDSQDSPCPDVPKDGRDTTWRSTEANHESERMTEEHTPTVIHNKETGKNAYGRGE